MVLTEKQIKDYVYYANKFPTYWHYLNGEPSNKVAVAAWLAAKYRFGFTVQPIVYV